MTRPNHTTGGIFTGATEALLRRDLAQAIADRDRARAIAVALEQEVAAANAALWEAESRLDEVTFQVWPQGPAERTEPDHV